MAMTKLCTATVCVRVWVGLTVAAVPASAQIPRVISVPAGGNLQTAIDSALPGDTIRGREVFTTTCAICHGADGQGTNAAPPLWGPHSYNIGAGMARVRTAAWFIHQAMPFDKPGTLTPQQSFDVATYINSRPRPDFRDKADDWPNGDPPPDVAYPTKAAGRKGSNR